MTGEALLRDLSARGIELEVRGERLKVSASRGVLSDTDRQNISDNKSDLIRLLQRPGRPGSTDAATVTQFVAECCVLDANARTLGRDLLLAHARWRRVMGAPDRTASWQEVEEELRASGCTEKMNDGSPVWLGVTLKSGGPHTAPSSPEPSPSRQTYAPCPRCGCPERWPTTHNGLVCPSCFLADRIPGRTHVDQGLGAGHQHEAPTSGSPRNSSVQINNVQIELSPGMLEALHTMENSHSNVLLTGQAGTGKTTLLQHFRDTTTKNVVVLAPTGTAAVTGHGQTIHRFFRFKPGITVGEVHERWVNDVDIYRELQAIIIDEISMVRADLLDCVDAHLRRFGPHKNRPFGGVQMIFTGDLYQLPPVVPRDEEALFREHYPGPYFFDAPSYRAAAFQTVTLATVYRQQDPTFRAILGGDTD